MTVTLASELETRTRRQDSCLVVSLRTSPAQREVIFGSGFGLAAAVLT